LLIRIISFNFAAPKQTEFAWSKTHHQKCDGNGLNFGQAISGAKESEFALSINCGVTI
jgi:hypothetical protein